MFSGSLKSTKIQHEKEAKKQKQKTTSQASGNDVEPNAAVRIQTFVLKITFKLAHFCSADRIKYLRQTPQIN